MQIHLFTTTPSTVSSAHAFGVTAAVTRTAPLAGRRNGGDGTALAERCVR